MSKTTRGMSKAHHAKTTLWHPWKIPQEAYYSTAEDLHALHTACYSSYWLHQMRSMWPYSKQPIATCDPVVWCVSLFTTWLCCAKTADWIEVLYGLDILWAQSTLLDGVLISLQCGGLGAGKFIATRIRSSICQITLASCYYWVINNSTQRYTVLYKKI